MAPVIIAAIISAAAMAAAKGYDASKGNPPGIPPPTNLGVGAQNSLQSTIGNPYAMGRSGNPQMMQQPELPIGLSSALKRYGGQMYG